MLLADIYDLMEIVNSIKHINFFHVICHFPFITIITIIIKSFLIKIKLSLKRITNVTLKHYFVKFLTNIIIGFSNINMNMNAEK